MKNVLLKISAIVILLGGMAAFILYRMDEVGQREKSESSFKTRKQELHIESIEKDSESIKVVNSQAVNQEKIIKTSSKQEPSVEEDIHPHSQEFMSSSKSMIIVPKSEIKILPSRISSSKSIGIFQDNPFSTGKILNTGSKPFNIDKFSSLDTIKEK